MSTRIKLLRLLGASMVTLAVVPWLGTSPAAADGDPPVSGDSRATAHDGNVTTCAEAGLSGSDISAHVTASGGTTQYLDITAVEAGYTVSGIVVKGGDNYNKYVPGQLGLGLTPPWDDLHAPMVGSQNQNVPTISHWFVCGSQGTTPPPTTSAPVTTTATNTVTTTASSTVTQTVSTTATTTQTETHTTTVPGPTETITTVSPGPTETVTETSPGPTVTVTVTQPGPTTTTTLPGSTETVTTTAPGGTQTVTSPGPTVTVTVTETAPTQTVTNTQTTTAPGSTVTVTQPGETQTVTTTAPGSTVTVTQSSTQTQTVTTTAPGSTQTVTTTAPGQSGTITTTAPGQTNTVTVTETVTTTGGTSVLPTKIGNSTVPDDDDDTGVLGTKTGVLADTGLDLPMPAVLGLSFGLLLAGGALMVVPARMATERTRRH